jgi:hypothetical protein
LACGPTPAVRPGAGVSNPLPPATHSELFLLVRTELRRYVVQPSAAQVAAVALGRLGPKHSPSPVVDRQAAEGQGFDDVRQMPGGAIDLLNGLWADLPIRHAEQGKCAHGYGDREDGPFRAQRPRPKAGSPLHPPAARRPVRRGLTPRPT